MIARRLAFIPRTPATRLGPSLSSVVLFQKEFGLQVSDIRMADEGQVDCQRWTDGGGRGLLDGEVSVGRGAGEGQHLLRDLERAGRQRGRIIQKPKGMKL